MHFNKGTTNSSVTDETTTARSRARLVNALHAAGLREMAERAERGHYSDFDSPLALPKMALAEELADAGTAAALRLRTRVVMGDFDDEADDA
jgi:hypothetical protein